MELFVTEILADIDWRIDELITIKTIPIRYNFSDDHKKVHYKYSVPAIYSLWEGFVKTTFETYTRHLNSKSIKRIEIAPELLTHVLDSACDFNTPRYSGNSKIRLTKLINNQLKDTITIPATIPTESNVNFKVLNKILGRYCITPINTSYERGMNKLLLFRNKVSHGDNAIRVDITNITEFIKLVEDLMLDVIISIEISCRTETYKN
jgi:hypothetical protein